MRAGGGVLGGTGERGGERREERERGGGQEGGNEIERGGDETERERRNSLQLEVNKKIDKGRVY